jgi:LPS sulfotransferase NodH
MGETWDQFGHDYDHPHFSGEASVYLIASTPRSGSHFLGHLLFGTGALGSPLEYLHPAHMRTWMSVLGVDSLSAMMESLSRRRTSPSGWFGIKAHWPEFARIAGDEALRDALPIRRYIFIRRRDRIAQAISALIAFQTKALISFHAPIGEPRYDFGAIRGAVAGLDAQNRQWEDFFERRSIAPLIVDYEDLVADADRVVDAILTDLGVARSNRTGPTWMPERQASDLNARWREQYLQDMASQPA